jgi:hypothetical protein
MSFGGHALDALKRIQYNRSLLQMRRIRYQELKNTISNVKAKYYDFQNHNELSEEELISYKKKIKSSIYKNRRTSFLRTCTVTILVGLIIIFIVKYLYTFFLNSF